MTTLTIHPAMRERLARAGLDTFEALWSAAVQAETTGPVDGHAMRRVTCLTVPDPAGGPPAVLYAKRYWGREAGPRWTDLLRLARPMTPAEREWRNARRLQDTGVPVAAPVAWGRSGPEEPETGPTSGRGGRALVVFEEAPGRPLAAWLAEGRSAPPPPRRRWAVLRAVARLVARLHEAGLSFPDLYAKHVFVSGTDGPADAAAALIDVYRLRRVAPWRRVEDLARLYVSARATGLTEADGYRLVLAYVEALARGRTGPPGSFPDGVAADGAPAEAEATGAGRAFAAPARPGAWDRRLRLRARRLYRRVRRRAARMPGRGQDPNLLPSRSAPGQVGSHVPPADDPMVELDGGRLRVRASLRPHLEAAGLSTLDALMGYEGGEGGYREVPGRWTVRLALPDPSGGPAVAVFLKRYTRVPLRTRVRRLLGLHPPRSQAAQEVRGIVRLQSLGVPTVRQVLVGERLRWRGWWEASCLGTEELAGAVEADRFCEARFSGPPTAERTAEKRRLIRRIADIARRLHLANLSHRDLYLCHFMVCPTAPGAAAASGLSGTAGTSGDGRTGGGGRSRLETPGPGAEGAGEAEERAEQAGPRVYLIDLQRLTHHRRGIGRRWVVKDLAALLFSSWPGPGTHIRSPVFSDTDRLRFARAYFGTDRLTAAQKRLLRRVVAKARRIARREARRTARRRRRRREGATPAGTGGGGASATGPAPCPKGPRTRPCPGETTP